MKSVDRLVKEHDLIERGLNLLEKSVSLIESGQPVPEDFPKWAPEFFRQFADKVRSETGGIPIGYKLSAQHIEADINAALAIIRILVCISPAPTQSYFAAIA